MTEHKNRLNLYINNYHLKMVEMLCKKLSVTKNELVRRLLEEYFYGHDMHKLEEWKEQ